MMDSERLKLLIQLAADPLIAELELQDEDFHVRIVTANQDAPAAVQTVLSDEVPPLTKLDGAQSSQAPDSGTVVASPLHGLLHLSPSPSDPHFVSEGSTVEQGDTLCVIESMKMLNPITAPCSGKILTVYAKDGSDVASEQALFQIG